MFSPPMHTLMKNNEHKKTYNHYTKVHPSSLWVSLDFDEFGHFYLVKLINPLMNGDQLVRIMNYFIGT